MSGKSINYGQGNAIMVLVGEVMGLNPGHLEDAKKMVKGLSVHPMVGKSIEDEAIRLNDKLRHDVSLITNANEHAQDIVNHPMAKARGLKGSNAN